MPGQLRHGKHARSVGGSVPGQQVCRRALRFHEVRAKCFQIRASCGTAQHSDQRHHRRHESGAWWLRVPDAASAPIWATWWLGDAVGEVVIFPLLLLWFAEPHVRWRRAQLLEAVAVVACLILTGLVVFHGIFSFVSKDYPLGRVFRIPLLVWVAVRLGQREAATATFLLAGIAIWGTYRGLGPFAVGTQNEDLLLLQSFIGVASVTAMALAALFAERRQIEEQAHVLAISDPLTGLGNYRKLIDTLEGEIRRSDRTGRSFAFLLMDLDGLKKINDLYGHLVGNSRAVPLGRCAPDAAVEVLTRPRAMAETSLRSSFRRQTEAAARQVARRIRETSGARWPVSCDFR